MEVVLRNIASNIHFFREEDNLTQEELARECGYCRAYIAKIEQAVKMPSLEVLTRLANTFEVAVSELFSRTRRVGHNERSEASDGEGIDYGAPVFESFPYLVVSMDDSGKLWDVREIPFRSGGLSRRYCYGKELWDVDFLNASDSVYSALQTLLTVAEERDAVRTTMRGTIDETESVRSDLILCGNSGRQAEAGYTLQLFWPRYHRGRVIDDPGDIAFTVLEFETEESVQSDVPVADSRSQSALVSD